MGRQPSAETELRRVKRELRVMTESRDSWKWKADQYKQEKVALFRKIDKLESEIESWQKRFDLLLASRSGQD